MLNLISVSQSQPEARIDNN